MKKLVLWKDHLFKKSLYRSTFDGYISDDIVSELREMERFHLFKNVNINTSSWFDDFKKQQNDISNEEISLTNEVVENEEISLTNELVDMDSKDSVDTLQNVIDSSPSAMKTLDLGGIITSWNKASEEFFGWTEEEVIGKFNPTVPENLKEIYLNRIKEERINNEVKAFTKENSLVDILLSSNPLFDEYGNFIGSIAHPVRNESSDVNGISLMYQDISEGNKDVEKK
ncbi:hypothetical protein B6U98_00055 [Thermoplasmatales archaeon ex4572_165]|nr:MAG: hypothetical protein B6U98_00055 [Thermoplasmatales archaeon ex4572_165]